MFQLDKDFPLTADLREHILSELPCGICVARQDERLSVVFANNNYYHMLGYDSMEQMEACAVLGAIDCVEPKMRAEMFARLSALSETGNQAVAMEARLTRRDGSTLWAIIHASRAQSGGGIWICAFMDISAAKARGR